MSDRDGRETAARPDWSAIAGDSVIHADAAPDASRRVSRAVAALAGRRFTDAGLLLALRLAASTGPVHDRLTEADAWYRAAQAGAGARTDRRALAVAVLSFIVAVVGPILAFPSVRTASEYLLRLEPAAVASGALAAGAAMWFLLAEAARIPFAGTRTRLYGPAVFVVPVALVTAAIVTTLIRVNDEGGATATTTLGIVLQFVAAALYVTAALAAIRNRRATAADQDDALHDRMADALAGGTGVDDAAAVAGLRELFERGALSPERARTALEALLRDPRTKAG